LIVAGFAMAHSFCSNNVAKNCAGFGRAVHRRGPLLVWRVKVNPVTPNQTSKRANAP
jgi:hypothetical protein